MGLEFFKKKKQEDEMKKAEVKLQQAKNSLAKFKSTSIKPIKERMIKEDDDLIVDEDDSGSEEYEEPEEVEQQDDVIEMDEPEQKERPESNIKTIVVKEIPVQPVLRYKDQKTGQEVRFITIEEALTKILEKLEE